jgi:hypothetical protein
LLFSFFVSSFPSALLCHSFFYFHVHFVSFLLRLLIFVCIFFILSLYLLILATKLAPFCVSFFCVYFTQLLLWKRSMVHYHIQCGLYSVRRPYMDLLNLIVYYLNIAK